MYNIKRYLLMFIISIGPEHLSCMSDVTYSKIHFWNKSINIDARNIILLPLDSSHRDESNEYKIIKIQSVVIEITGACSLKILKNTPKISKFLKILYDQ